MAWGWPARSKRQMWPSSVPASTSAGPSPKPCASQCYMSTLEADHSHVVADVHVGCMYMWHMSFLKEGPPVAVTKAAVVVMIIIRIITWHMAHSTSLAHIMLYMHTHCPGNTAYGSHHLKRVKDPLMTAQFADRQALGRRGRLHLCTVLLPLFAVVSLMALRAQKHLWQKACPKIKL
jgi:hypothetical protein